MKLNRLLSSLVLAGLAIMLTAGTAAADPAATAPVQYRFANTDGYQASEDVGQYPVTIDRSDASQSGVICWGATNASAEPGDNFSHVPNTQVQFAAGQSTATVYVPIHDQGINGPPEWAWLYMFRCGGDTTVATSRQKLTLLEDDPLQTREPGNILGYRQPTDGDPLQYVDWYIFGAQSEAGKFALAYKKSNPAWSRAFDVLADTPGSGNIRFWMWSQPTSKIARNVEIYLANAERAQPGTTVQMTSYDLVHGKANTPSKIENHYEQWITQLAKGIGNFRVVFYLEEDALITAGSLSPAELKVREAELAYAVRALEQDPHVVVYIDSGASDTLISAKQYAKMLKASDIAQAQGFFLNSTHNMWVTTEMHFGQQISRYLGGAHFIVQSGTAGRGPDLNPHPATQGVEDLCNPPGIGLGPITWDTGYKYVDGLLWFPSIGITANSACHDGEPGLGKFWPAYAYGIVERRVDGITGPKYHLIRSQDDM